MDLVVDASVIIAVIANEPEKDQLITLTKESDLIAPTSIHWEIGNVFSAMLKQRRITLNEALRAIDLYSRIPLRFVEVELEESLKLAAELNIYAYDACLIRCAIKYDAQLASLDKSLIRFARKKGIFVMEVN